MSVQVENLEKNTAKLTIEVPAEKFEEAVQHSYNKNKGKFNIPGFRKGKAPFNMIKKMYGVGVFYEDAVFWTSTPLYSPRVTSGLTATTAV